MDAVGTGMKPIAVPDIGDFKDVPIIEIMVAVGDAVAKDQPLAVVESDKATMEIPSPESGIVAVIDVRVGDKVSKGSRLLSLRAGEERAASTLTPPDSSRAQVSPEERSEVPRAAVHEMAEERANVVRLPVQASTSARSTVPSRIYAGSAVRKLARDFGVMLSDVKGSGPRGRIVSDDVRAHVKSAMQTLARRAAGDGGEAAVRAVDAPFALPPWPKIDFAAFGPIESRPLSRIRRISGANLHRNWVTIPHVTNHEDADVTELEAFRAELKRENGPAGARVSPLAFIVKACIAALKEFPQFNASLEGDALILKRYYHIGFAADTSNGLVVPVIRNADGKGIVQIAREMGELAAKARAGKLTAADMQGGSFSISSLGGIGGSYFTPIINAPEVAILGVGRIQTRVVWAAGQPQPRLLMPMSLSWDHRVIDGAAAGRFNAYLARALADLRRLLL
jgi:pyruvate dehydrogenase E2 component (dihydrolipoamide acetyltransferase)